MSASKDERKKETKEKEEEEESETSQGVGRVKVPKGTRDTLPEQIILRDRAFTIIKNVFLRHGAVGIDTPVFELKETLMGKYGEDSKLIYELADQGGELLALRYDLTVPFARYVANHGITNMKRYHIGRVYRRDNPKMTRGRFREFYQCDFDIAGFDSAPIMLIDAEIIQIVCEVLEALEIGEFVIKINHRQLIDVLMQVTGIPKDKFHGVCSAIDKLDKEEWSVVRDELINIKKVSQQATDKLGTFVTRNSSNLKKNPSVFLAELRKEKEFQQHEQAQKVFDELDALFKYLKIFGCLDSISLDLSLARGLNYYTGLIYEAMLKDPTGKMGAIAAGGRYDDLIGMFSDRKVPAVGVSIGIERIFSLLEQIQQKKGAIRKNQTLVYVASIGENLLEQRLKLATELWKANIPCEYMYHLAPKPKKQLDDVLSDQIPVVVWIGENELKENKVKVKKMEQKTEEDIPRDQLVSFLRKNFSLSDGNVSQSSVAKQ